MTKLARLSLGTFVVVVATLTILGIAIWTALLALTGHGPS